MTSAFVYLRVSGKSQVRGDGFRRQFLACREYATTNKLKIVRVFKERGVSGTKELENRPQLSLLFAALEANGVKTILIEKLDRLARDLMVSETIVKDIKTSGYTLLSTCEPDLCSNDPSRNFMRVIFSALAQLEKELLVLKLRGARERIRAKGIKCDGRKAWGEKPGEAEILQRMRNLRDMVPPVGYQEIADILNSSSVPTRMGKRWKASTIQKILSRKQVGRES